MFSAKQSYLLSQVAIDTANPSIGSELYRFALDLPAEKVTQDCQKELRC